jgi:hypothetical protein
MEEMKNKINKIKVLRRFAVYEKEREEFTPNLLSVVLNSNHKLAAPNKRNPPRGREGEREK